MPDGKQLADMQDRIRNHLARYIATDGADGYWWDTGSGEGKSPVPTLLLTTIGRKTGRSITLPLIFGRSGADFVVVASKGGSPNHPAWYLNLVADPAVRVQVKAEKFHAQSHTADSAERASLWPLMVKVYSPYAQFQQRTERLIPIVVLRRVGIRLLQSAT